MSQRVRRLSDMEFDEVSLVGTPANQMAKVALWKSATKEAPGIMADTTTELPPEAQEYIASLEKANADLQARVDELNKHESAEEDLLKGADPELAELVKGLQDRAEAAELVAKAERDHRLAKEFSDRVADELSHIPVVADEFGQVLRKANEALDPETYASLYQALVAADGIAAQAGLTHEVGKASGTAATGPVDRIEQMAKSLQSQDNTLTYEQAFAKVLADNPGLYADYRKEG